MIFTTRQLSSALRQKQGGTRTPSDGFTRGEATRADVGYGDGLIAAADGTARFASYLPVGAIHGAWLGNGFQRPAGAEIHVVINDHGPLRAAVAQSMLGSYRGGCTDESVPELFPATARADGEPGPNTCRLVQAVVFAQESVKRAQGR